MMPAQQRALFWSFGLLGTFPVAFVAQPWIVSTSLIICPFRAITGLPCIFCGLTRAFAYATHGDFAAATQQHPLWWLAALIVAAWGVALLLRAMGPVYVIERRAWRPLGSAAVVAIIVGGSLLRALAARGWTL